MLYLQTGATFALAAPRRAGRTTRLAHQLRQLRGYWPRCAVLVAREQISRRGDGNLARPYFLSHFFSMMRVSAVSLKLLPAIAANIAELPKLLRGK